MRKPLNPENIHVTEEGRIVYSRFQFTGMIPIGAKGYAIETIPNTLDLPDYLGIIRFKQEPEQLFYYFKTYNFDGESLSFQEASIADDRDYYFFTCPTRLRKDFELVAYNYQDGTLSMTTVPTGHQHIFGELLFNFHQVGETSLAQHTFLFPNEHLKTSRLNESRKTKLAGMLGIEKFVNDSTGCDSLVAYGNHLPIFKRTGEVLDDLGVVQKPYSEEYFLLTRGTDNTASFCVGHTKVNEQPLPQNIMVAIEMAEQYESFSEKLGIANKEVKKYTAGRFRDRYGLHILEEEAWLMGFYDLIPYS